MLQLPRRRPLSFWTPWLMAFSVISSVNGQESVYQKLLARSDFSLFRDVLRFSGFGESSILADTSQALTLYAPTNEAIMRDSVVSAYLDQPGWGVHLKELSELHMVVGAALGNAALFSNDATLNSAQGSLEVSKANRTIAGLSIVEGGTIFATNGIIHTINGVFKNEWKGVTLGDRVASLASSSVNDVVAEAGFSKELDKFMEFGTTFLATADQFFEVGENVALWKASLNDSSTGKAYNNLLYNTINVNLYEQLLRSGINYVASPRGGGAHMWVTKDKDGTIRFNDAVASGFEMAENGVFYVVDKLLSPPTIIEFLGITATYSDLDVTNAYDLFTASSWNTTNLVRSLEIETGKLTLFAPTDESFMSRVPIQEIDRILSPLWSHHLDDLLKHWLTNKSYTRKALRDIALTAGGALELTMLSGSTITVVAESDDGLSIVHAYTNSGGSFVKPNDLKGVDGLIHVVDTVLLPPSFQQTVFQRATDDPLISTLASLIGASQVEDLVGDTSPITFLAPEDLAFDGYIVFFNESTELLMTHVFEGLFFADTLLEMDGETITSLNNVDFLVTVVDGTVTIASNLTNATVVASDILGNTGVMHRIDGVLLNAPLRSATTSPSPATTQLILTGEVVTEDNTYVPTKDLDTEIPDASLAPSEAQSQSGTMAGTATITETVAPSDEKETMEPSTDSPTSEAIATDSPTSVAMDPMEPTLGVDNMPETPNETVLAEAVVATASPLEHKIEDHTIAPPSSPPTQLVLVLTPDDPSEQEEAPQSPTDGSSTTTTASATSSANRSRQSINLLSTVLSLCTSFVAICFSLAAL